MIGESDEACIFFFDMWGRRCQTCFPDMQAAIGWIYITYEKGWLVPVQLTDIENSRTYNTKAIIEMIGEI